MILRKKCKECGFFHYWMRELHGRHGGTPETWDVEPEVPMAERGLETIETEQSTTHLGFGAKQYEIAPKVRKARKSKLPGKGLTEQITEDLAKANDTMKKLVESNLKTDDMLTTTRSKAKHRETMREVNKRYRAKKKETPSEP